MSDASAAYISQDLWLPKAFDDEFSDLLVGRKADDTQPFPRKVDLWWATICIGASLGKYSAVAKDRVKFGTGQVLASEQWRIAHMELLALAREGEEALRSPVRVVRIADEYGTAGIAWITEHLRGESNPTLKLLVEIDKIGDHRLHVDLS